MPPERETISTLGRALREGRLSSRALTDACLTAIAERGPALNAFITVTTDTAKAQADRADEELRAGVDRGPLHGIPISLKDLIDVAGVPTTAASHVRDGHVASRDAMVTTRLREAGAVLVGKVNLHEFALGTTSEDSAYGPTRHPLDPSRSAGGSSGGSAVSVATGMAVASIGTDTGGSIRIPAAACGIVGLKPTTGEIPLDGVVPLSPTYDHVGPLCRSVDDARIVYDVLRGSTPARPKPAAAKGLRLGIPRDYFLAMLDDEVATVFAEACARLTRSGISVVDVSIAHTASIVPTYLHVSLPEAAEYHARTLERCPDAYTPNVRIRLESGRYLLAEDYVRAQRGRTVLRDAVDAALDGCDALLLPTIPIPAPVLGMARMALNGRDELVRNLLLRLTQLFNITGHPALALPCGATGAGLPVSAQLVGRLHATAALLDVAATVERQLVPDQTR